VNRYELEARRRNVEVEKKQHELDLLNWPLFVFFFFFFFRSLFG